MQKSQNASLDIFALRRVSPRSKTSMRRTNEPRATAARHPKWRLLLLKVSILRFFLKRLERSRPTVRCSPMHTTLRRVGDMPLSLLLSSMPMEIPWGQKMAFQMTPCRSFLPASPGNWITMASLRSCRLTNPQSRVHVARSHLAKSTV